MPKGVHDGDRTPKRTESQRQLDRAEMVHLLRRGWTKVAIAEKFGLHPTQISYDWKRVLTQVQDDMRDEAGLAVAAQLERNAEVERDLKGITPATQVNINGTVNHNHGGAVGVFPWDALAGVAGAQALLGKGMDGRPVDPFSEAIAQALGMRGLPAPEGTVLPVPPPVEEYQAPAPSAAPPAAPAPPAPPTPATVEAPTPAPAPTSQAARPTRRTSKRPPHPAPTPKPDATPEAAPVPKLVPEPDPAHDTTPSSRKRPAVGKGRKGGNK